MITRSFILVGVTGRAYHDNFCPTPKLSDKITSHYIDRNDSISNIEKINRLYTVWYWNVVLQPVSQTEPVHRRHTEHMTRAL